MFKMFVYEMRFGLLDNSDQYCGLFWHDTLVRKLNSKLGLFLNLSDVRTITVGFLPLVSSYIVELRRTFTHFTQLSVVSRS